MYKAALFSALIFITNPVSAEVPLVGASGPGRTVTIGTEVAPGELPGVVKLSIGGSTCTGTLIDADVIITAAHCVLTASGKLEKEVRYEFRKTAEGNPAYKKTLTLSAENTAVHPSSNYTEDGKVKFRAASDIAIIVLPKKVPFAENRVIHLAENASGKKNRVYVVAGWGLQLPEAGGSISSDRKLMVSTALTFERAGSKTTAIQLSGTAIIKATGEEVSVAACHGDSGGPTLQLRSLDKMRDQQTIELIGVTTAYSPSDNLPEDLKPTPENLTKLQQVERCAVPGSRSLSASVPAHRKWIDTTIASLRGA